MESQLSGEKAQLLSESQRGLELKSCLKQLSLTQAEGTEAEISWGVKSSCSHLSWAPHLGAVASSLG